MKAPILFSNTLQKTKRKKKIVSSIPGKSEKRRMHSLNPFARRRSLSC